MSSIDQLTIDDFYISTSIEAKTESLAFWDGSNCQIDIWDVPKEVTNSKEAKLLAATHWEEMNKRIQWLYHNKELILDVLVEEGFLDSANNWEDEPLEFIDGKAIYQCAITKKKFSLPITRQDFSQSIQECKIQFSLDANEVFATYLYLDLSPSFTLGHTIELSLSSDESVYSLEFSNVIG